MKIVLLTPIYATTTAGSGATPVVHYFAREWVKLGHDVTVYHIVPRFPRFFYFVGKQFQHQLNTRLGVLVPTDIPNDADYDVEGVFIHRRVLRKNKPHSSYSKKQLQKVVNIIIEKCEKDGIPDWFIGHWDNPQLELLTALKERLGKPTCLVLHQNDFDFEKSRGKQSLRMIKMIDVVGFRSLVGQKHFITKYGEPKCSFIASSGVSSLFVKEGQETMISVKQPVRNFIFVGSLIQRKNPVVILQTLMKLYPHGDFKMTYIGDGAERATIEMEHRKTGNIGEVVFTGRLPREKVIEYLKQSDVFVMVSSSEVFGLVYLEAMALGLIVVGSRNEGIDGIIKDSENGFLCGAGNEVELYEVLRHIRDLPEEQLQKISSNAKATAMHYSDRCVAIRYLDTLQQYKDKKCG